MTTITHIGKICNEYGGLVVRYEDGIYYFGIVNECQDVDWEEIPERLFIELINFNSNGDSEQ